MPLRAALAGNPNCGKTTLFNALTGSRLYVGNWPGVTVEKKAGFIRGASPAILLTDLPGTYSLCPFSLEERAARDCIYEGGQDVIIAVANAAELGRSLYLTAQLTELGTPVVLALNMADEAARRGIKTDSEALGRCFGVPVVAVSGRTGQGLGALIQAIRRAAAGRSRPHPRLKYDAPTQRALDALLPMAATASALSPIRNASRLLEQEEDAENELGLRKSQRGEVERIRRAYADESGQTPAAAFAAARYAAIDLAMADVVKYPPPAVTATEKLDRVLMARRFAAPVFLAVMLSAFWLAFGAPGAALKALFEHGTALLAGLLPPLLSRLGVSVGITAFFSEAVVGGVGAVLAFLPQIALLFLFLSVLEDSGYMARAAFAADGVLRRFGLTGRSFIPMLLGFGCSVPAIMAAKSLGSERERRLTSALIPFMSCGAKLSVYGLLSGVFFPGRAAPVAGLLYLTGLCIAAVCAAVLGHKKRAAAPPEFVMELPPYRFPDVRGLGRHVWEHVRGFITKAGTVILAVNALVWALGRFGAELLPAANPSESLLAALGRIFAPALAPLGFGSWQSAAALLAGVAAKESVAASLTLLLGRDGLAGAFTPLSACSFMLFVLLYTPCAAALAACRKEFGVWAAVAQCVFQTALAWAVCFCFYQLCSMFLLLSL